MVGAAVSQNYRETGLVTRLGLIGGGADQRRQNGAGQSLPSSAWSVEVSHSRRAVSNSSKVAVSYK